MNYEAYGLVIHSELALPELLKTDQTNIDVYISFQEIDKKLEHYKKRKNRIWSAEKNYFELNAKGIAYFSVRNGNTIYIDPYDGTPNEDLRFVLLGSVLAALLQQRRFLTLHAGAIQTPRGAILFVGPSGNGKSTLTAAFAQRGYTIISDDVVALEVSNHAIIVSPSFPKLRLWGDSVSKLKMQTDHLTKSRAGMEKYLLPLQKFLKTTEPLYKIYVLGVHNQSTTLFHQMSGSKKIPALLENTYRIKFLSGLGLVSHHHKQILSIASKIEMTQITRPLHPFMLEELCQKIEADLI